MLQRKLERELVYGGAPPINGSAENDECEEEDEENEPIASISGIFRQTTQFKHVLVNCMCQLSL